MPDPLCAEKPGQEKGWATAKDKQDIKAQAKKILDWLSQGGWHPVWELENISGSRRVAARCFDLKKRGYQIESRREEGRTWAYRLVSGQGTLWK